MFIPLYDDGPDNRSGRPYATYALILLTITAFGFQIFDQELIAIFGLIPAFITGPSLSVPLFATPVTLVTYQFLHADALHVLSNMLFLWIFGDNVEDSMGSLRFVPFYLVCGIAGGLGHVIAEPQSFTPLIGASGATSGVIAAYLMVRPCAKISVFFLYTVVRLSALWVLGVYVLVQFINVLVPNPGDSVAYWTHLGGLAAGAALFPLLRHSHVELFQCVGRRT